MSQFNYPVGSFEYDLIEELDRINFSDPIVRQAVAEVAARIHERHVQKITASHHAAVKDRVHVELSKALQPAKQKIGEMAAALKTLEAQL